MGALGYVAVGLPERGEWQGIVVLPCYKHMADEMMDAVRSRLGKKSATLTIPW